MLISRRAPPANCAANASTTMPPSDGPTTRVELLDAQRAHDLVAAARDVLDRQLREIRADRRWPVAGSIEAGPGGAEAAAQRIHADDEVAVGVDGLAGADHLLPPALARDRRGDDAACAEGDRPVNSRIALLRAALSSPQLS